VDSIRGQQEPSTDLSREGHQEQESECREVDLPRDQRDGVNHSKKPAPGPEDGARAKGVPRHGQLPDRNAAKACDRCEA
jgi:hypothetical protein